MTELHSSEIWNLVEPTTGEADVIDLRDHRHEASDGTRQVSLVDLGATNHPLRAEMLEAVQGVISRGDFVLGADVQRLEEEFAGFCGESHAIGVDSGFSALELILRAFEVGPGDEVITSANTFHATVRAIEACGARPVLVDADPITRNMDPSLLEPAITGATRAILPVHLYGHPADMESINEVARAHGLLVFEDACQAHGSLYHGRRAGSLADAAAFSFYPTKNLGALGDAGIVVTGRADIDERIRRLRNLGSMVRNQHDERGFNRRLDTLQAAILRVKLMHLDASNRVRQQVASWYREELDGLDITLPETAERVEPVFHLYVIESEWRDELAAHLDERGVETGIHYPVPIHLQRAFRSLGHARGDFPVSEGLARRILSLPMHTGMTPDDVRHVAEAICHSQNVVGSI